MSSVRAADSRGERDRGKGGRDGLCEGREEREKYEGGKQERKREEKVMDYKRKQKETEGMCSFRQRKRKME